MPRALDSALLTALEAGVIQPAILVKLVFRSSTEYIWTGIGTLVYDAQTFTGVGALGSFGGIAEGLDTRAEGTTLTLSGIDPTLYADCLSEIQLGAEAKIWFALLSEGVIVGAPYLVFGGLVDKPTIVPGAETITITLALENKLTNLQRATSRRYTTADQHIDHPLDTAFNWVEQLNDQALRWGH